jgi:cbb3-type cytochrome oxidase subunit 3
MSLSDVMSAAGLGSWAEIGLVISFVTFVAIVVWVLFRRKGRWEHDRRLPLDDDTHTDDAGGTLR